MATIADVRAALAAAASQAGVKVQPYESDSIVTPCGFVSRRAMDPRMVFSGATNVYRFAIVVYVSRTSEHAAQVAVDRLAETSGAYSLKAAIENETHWPDGLVHYAAVVEIGETATYDVAGVSYLGLVVEIEVVF